MKLISANNLKQNLVDESQIRWIYLTFQKLLLHSSTKSITAPQALRAAAILGSVSETQAGRNAISSFTGFMLLVKDMIFSVLNVNIQHSSASEGNLQKIERLKEIFANLLRVLKNVAGSPNLQDKLSALECGAVQIFLHLLEASNIGKGNLLAVCSGLRGLCEASSIRRNLAFEDTGCDQCVASDREKLREPNCTSLSSLPVLFNDKIVAWRITLLLQRNDDTLIFVDGLSTLLHLLNTDDIKQMVLSNTAFLKTVISLLRNETDQALRLLSASIITACISDKTDFILPLLEIGGPLVLAETADCVLSGAEQGLVALSSSGYFQNLMNLISALQDSVSLGTHADRTDCGALRVAAAEKSLRNRYEMMLKYEVVEDAQAQHGSTLKTSDISKDSITISAPEVRTEDISDGYGPLRPFGWLFRGTSVPAAVKRSPRPVESEGLTSRSGPSGELSYFRPPPSSCLVRGKAIGVFEPDIILMTCQLAGPMDRLEPSIPMALSSPRSRDAGQNSGLSADDCELLIRYLATRHSLADLDTILSTAGPGCACSPPETSSGADPGARALQSTSDLGFSLKLSYLPRPATNMSRPKIWDYRALEDTFPGACAISHAESAAFVRTLVMRSRRPLRNSSREARDPGHGAHARHDSELEVDGPGSVGTKRPATHHGSRSLPVLNSPIITCTAAGGSLPQPMPPRQRESRIGSAAVSMHQIGGAGAKHVLNLPKNGPGYFNGGGRSKQTETRVLRSGNGERQSPAFQVEKAHAGATRRTEAWEHRAHRDFSDVMIVGEGGGRRRRRAAGRGPLLSKGSLKIGPRRTPCGGGGQRDEDLCFRRAA